MRKILFGILLVFCISPLNCSDLHSEDRVDPKNSFKKFGIPFYKGDIHFLCENNSTAPSHGLTYISNTQIFYSRDKPQQVKEFYERRKKQMVEKLDFSNQRENDSSERWNGPKDNSGLKRIFWIEDSTTDPTKGYPGCVVPDDAKTILMLGSGS